MHALMIAKVVALLCSGLLAGIFLGHRAGAQTVLHKMSASSFIQLQQGIHVHYVRFMPVLILGALLSLVAWLVMIRPQGANLPTILVSLSTGGILLIAVLTRAISVPLNNRLMTWSPDAPPANLREIWQPWDRVNTIRTVVAAGALVCEAIVLSL